MVYCSKRPLAGTFPEASQLVSFSDLFPSRPHVSAFSLENAGSLLLSSASTPSNPPTANAGPYRNPSRSRSSRQGCTPSVSLSCRPDFTASWLPSGASRVCPQALVCPGLRAHRQKWRKHGKSPAILRLNGTSILNLLACVFSPCLFPMNGTAIPLRCLSPYRQACGARPLSQFSLSGHLLLMNPA